MVASPTPAEAVPRRSSGMRSASAAARPACALLPAACTSDHEERDGRRPADDEDEQRGGDTAAQYPGVAAAEREPGAVRQHAGERLPHGGGDRGHPGDDAEGRHLVVLAHDVGHLPRQEQGQRAEEHRVQAQVRQRQ
ncbi:hypothetical protein J4709_39065 [Actinomadura sp. LCR2-06]|uniref:Uncharacterized protein n=1 Tax=Actinomadura violacea TaxID=2819934 RepID=A0ABS3S3L2_9ACTN|nr:hypothetical protein [Actinomadura violacea]MBO2463588.1 hypothetical protein [Actinomadura violacea]